MGPSLPLITAIVIHYNNGNYIYETLASILQQDYPNIELLISDDCSPDGFDADGIIRYINQNRKENIKRVVIHENQQNLGTVRHLECIREKAQGDFELLIAADDVWYDEHVFSAFAQRFEELGPEAEWLTSQIEMCDITLQKVEKQFVPEHVIRLIKEGNYPELLNQELIECYLPGSGCAYRKSFFQKIHSLSEDYCLIEDYTTHLRALRMGIPIYFVDIISVKHRHGGISHGNTRNGDALFAKYHYDFLTAFRKEIEPYQSEFSEVAYRKAQLRYEAHCRTYKKLLEKEQSKVSYRAQKPLWIGLLKSAKGSLYQISRLKQIESDAKTILWIVFCALFFQQREDRIAFSGLRLVFRLSVLALTVCIICRVGINLALRIWEAGKRRRETG